MDFARLAVIVRRLFTDNRPCFCSRAFAAVCRKRQSKPMRTRFYTHVPLTPTYQWQSRTLHPIGHARMGLCPHLTKVRVILYRAAEK
jgi:hypothetical protein